MTDDQTTQAPAEQETPPEEAATAPDDAQEAPEGRYVSVDEAAEHLGISARTVRRRIQSEELKGKRAEHSHAWLVWIEGVAEPAEQEADEADDQAGEESEPEEQGSEVRLPAVRHGLEVDSLYPLTDLIGDLSQRNADLAAQLGAANERIKQLEGQLQALPAGELPPRWRPWWKRLFGID